MKVHTFWLVAVYAEGIPSSLFAVAAMIVVLLTLELIA
jgi:hypothetical protein